MSYPLSSISQFRVQVLELAIPTKLPGLESSRSRWKCERELDHASVVSLRSNRSLRTTSIISVVFPVSKTGNS